MTKSAFDTNRAFAEMRDELASRSKWLKAKEIGITIASGGMGALAGGLLTSNLLPDLGAVRAAIPGVVYGGAVGVMAGDVVKDYTLADTRKKLELDNKFAYSQADGNRNWNQYREEVLEHGHGLPPIPLMQQNNHARTA